MTGLLVGDALGAEYEGGIPERLLWKMIGKEKGKLRYTDDTEMNLVTARHYLENEGFDYPRLAMEYAREYKWSRGYGPSTAFVLRKIRKGMDYRIAAKLKFRDGSYGNGAAMRAPVLAVCLAGQKLGEALEVVDEVSAITHPNNAAMDGARSIFIATLLGFSDASNAEIIRVILENITGEEMRDKIRRAGRDVDGDNAPGVKELVKRYGNGTAAVDSCPLAVYMGLKFRAAGILEMLGEIRQCGGDTDTIGAMAGAVWGALNGFSRVPESQYRRIENWDGVVRLVEALNLRVSRRG